MEVSMVVPPKSSIFNRNFQTESCILSFWGTRTLGTPKYMATIYVLICVSYCVFLCFMVFHISRGQSISDSCLKDANKLWVSKRNWIKLKGTLKPVYRHFAVEHVYAWTGWFSVHFISAIGDVGSLLLLIQIQFSVCLIHLLLFNSQCQELKSMFFAAGKSTLCKPHAPCMVHWPMGSVSLFWARCW